MDNFILPLKAVDTVGNCQRLTFTVGVSHHYMQQICENLSSIGHRTCEILTKGKNTPVTRSCVHLG